MNSARFLQVHADKKWQHLKLSIQHANEIAPKVERKAKQCCMTEEILEKMETRKKAKNTPAYVAHNKEIRKLCRNEKEKFYNAKCDEIEENLKLNTTKKMHDNIKELTGKKKGNTRGGCIKDKDGNMIFERDKVLNRWVEYIGDMFADTRPPLPTPSNDRDRLY